MKSCNLIHAETDYLLSYPGEIGFDVEREEPFFRAQGRFSDNEIELLALVDWKSCWNGWNWRD